MRQLRRASPYLLIILGIGCGVWALVVWSRSQPPKPVAGVQVAANPSNKKPAQSDVEAYTVAADLPRYVAIPQIGVPKSRVMALGMDAQHQMAVPDNLYDVGWYKASGKPGQAGAMFMYGHVSGWKANGVFYNLFKLQPGNTITVTRGDNRTYTFRVVTIKRYPTQTVDMAAALAPVTRDREGLNLMTCAGKMDPATGEFSERLVVFASLVSS